MARHRTKVKLDSINRKILRIIHTEANISNIELSNRINLSPAAAYQRVKALKEAGFIIHFFAELDMNKLFEHIFAYAEFELESNSFSLRSRFEKAVNDVPEFVDCHRISGEYDYILFCCARDIEAMDAACRLISDNVDLGVKNSKIRVILDRTKWSLGYPFDKLKWKK